MPPDFIYLDHQATTPLAPEAREAMLAWLDALAPLHRVGEYTVTRVTERTIDQHLYTAGMPDPDLLVRTAGEMRVSNYLLWQISYAELFGAQ